MVDFSSIYHITLQYHFKICLVVLYSSIQPSQTQAAPTAQTKAHLLSCNHTIIHNIRSWPVLLSPTIVQPATRTSWAKASVCARLVLSTEKTDWGLSTAIFKASWTEEVHRVWGLNFTNYKKYYKRKFWGQYCRKIPREFNWLKLNLCRKASSISNFLYYPRMGGTISVMNPIVWRRSCSRCGRAYM